MRVWKFSGQVVRSVASWVTLNGATLSGDRSTPFAQRPGLAEDIRTVLRSEDQRHHQQHRAEAEPISEHDLHLDRNRVPQRVVGEVTSCQAEGKLVSYRPFIRLFYLRHHVFSVCRLALLDVKD